MAWCIFAQVSFLATLSLCIFLAQLASVSDERDEASFGKAW
jgi:hypothetical protein